MTSSRISVSVPSPSSEPDNANVRRTNCSTRRRATLGELTISVSPLKVLTLALNLASSPTCCGLTDFSVCAGADALIARKGPRHRLGTALSRHPVGGSIRCEAAAGLDRGEP